MNEINVAVTKLKNFKNLLLPRYATKHSAGLDLVAAIDSKLNIAPDQIVLLPTGIAISIPHGYEGQIRPRSGLSIKHGITIFNAPGTIDSDYRGELKIPIINLGKIDFLVERGMKVGQLIITEYKKIRWVTVSELPISTTRGDRGFGSTGDIQ